MQGRIIVINWPLLLAQHREVVELLLGKGANVNATGAKYFSTALHAASVDQTPGLLLSKGADIDAKSGRYGSAL